MPCCSVCFLLSLLAVTATGLPGAAPRDRPKPARPRLHPAAPAPVPAAKLEAVIGRGVDFLCRSQNADGSWGSARSAGGVDVDPMHGAFHSYGVATTALCLEALLDAGDAPKVRRAAARAETYLFKNLPKLRREDPDDLPNVWAHCYGIQVLAELHRRAPAGSDRRRKLEELLGQQRCALKRFQTVHGGWCYVTARGYQRPCGPAPSFLNAAVLVALHRAKGVGPAPDRRMLQRAIRSTAAQRKPDSSYLYFGSFRYPLSKKDAMAPVNRPAGSLGRSQACNLALRLWGDRRITDAVLKEWLDRLITRNGWLDMGRKRPIPHESFAQVAGYFFYFGHYYGALCIGQLPRAERPFYQDHLARLLMRLQEKDGSWYDFPLYSYHKPYGTAFALLALECCRKAPARR
jgi:hypothetical protein